MRLYPATTTSFLNNGLGVLHPIKCLEYKKKSLNGWYLECEFPIEYKDKIVQDVILFVETKEKGGQPFRCKNPKYKDNRIIVTANHVAFDSENYILEDVRPENLSPVSFLKWINDRTDKTSPYTVSSNVNGNGTKYFIRKTLLEAFKEAEILFSGMYDINCYSLDLKTRVGNDDGFVISYGKNLQSISIVEDWSSVCTKLLPVGPNGLILPETFLYSDIQYETPYTKVIEFSIATSYQDEEGNYVEYTHDELLNLLRDVANTYIKDSYIPKVNYSIKSDVPQSLCIGDTIYVKHPLVTLKTEVQSYTYNTISKRVLSIEFGNYDRDVKKLFDNIKQEINNAQNSANTAISIANSQTDIINNLNKNGRVYIDDNEILVLNTLPKENATQVWRLGLGGIGFSNNGYQGPFEYALTQDGWFNTKFIKAQSITTNHLSSDVGSSLDLTSNTSIKSVVSGLNDVKTQIEQTENDVTISIQSVATDASNAAKTATNHLKFDNNGLIVGDMTKQTLGRNVLIDTDSVDIRNSNQVLARYQDDKIQLGLNSDTSVIELCGNAGRIAFTQPSLLDDKFISLLGSNVALSATSIASIMAYVGSADWSKIDVSHNRINIKSVAGENSSCIDVEPVKTKLISNLIDVINNSISSYVRYLANGGDTVLGALGFESVDTPSVQLSTGTKKLLHEGNYREYISSSGGTSVSYDNATQTTSGLMSPDDKRKLDAFLEAANYALKTDFIEYSISINGDELSLIGNNEAITTIILPKSGGEGFIGKLKATDDGDGNVVISIV